MTRVHAVMACLVVLVLLQLLLLAVAVEGYLGQRTDVLLPSSLASGLCFAAAGSLIWQLGRRP